jgi:hypothetical protein
MFSTRGSSPLSYHRIGHADVGVISDIVLEPEQIEHYLGSCNTGDEVNDAANPAATQAPGYSRPVMVAVLIFCPG